MSLDFVGDRAVFGETVSIECADRLLEWLQQQASPRVDFAACRHVHPANLQVLMAAGTPVAVWPDDIALRGWLVGALNSC